MIYNPICLLLKWILSGGAGVLYVGGVPQYGMRSVTGAVTGKRYVEVVINSLSPTVFDANKPKIGITSAGLYPTLGAGIKQNGDVEVNNTPIGAVAALAINDIINIAFDTATGKVWLGVNSTWYSGGNPAAGTGETATLSIETWYVGCHNHGSGVSSGVSMLKVSLRTQVSQFTGTIPSGFTAWYN
jgi:hypothetical protein